MAPAPSVTARSAVDAPLAAFAKLTSPLAFVAEIVCAASSSVPAAPIPLCAVQPNRPRRQVRRRVRADSSIAPADVIAIVPPFAVTLSTNTLPDPVVVKVTSPAPPAVTVFAVSVLPAFVTAIEPFNVLAFTLSDPPV